MKRMICSILGVLALTALCVGGVVWISSAAEESRYTNAFSASLEEESDSDGNFSSDADLLSFLESEKDYEHPAKKQIKNVYSLEEFRTARAYTVDWNTILANSVNRSLYFSHKDFPVECVRKLDENTVYCVYRMKSEDENEVLLYTLYEKSSPNEGEESWQECAPVLLISEKKKEKDFSNISIGTSLEEVISADPVTACFVPRDEFVGWKETTVWNENGPSTEQYYVGPVLTFTSRHCLKDGILTINYERADENSAFLVTEKTFDPDFSLWNGYQIASRDLP